MIHQVKMAKKTKKPKAEKLKTTEEKSEEVEEVKPEETVEESKEIPKAIEAPKFKNNGKAIKINLGNRDESNWITVREGETVTIPEKIALANNLEKVE